MKKYARPTLHASLLTSLLIALLTACGGNTNTPQATRPQLPPAIPHQSPPIIFKGLRNDYSITRSATGFKVSDKSGVSTELASTAQIQFNDMRINLQIGDKAKSIAPVDLRALIDLYIAFFNRLPDADGLEYWIEQFKAGMSIDQISQNFYAAALLYSAQTGYDAKMTDEDFVRLIYKNVLGRSGAKAPPDADVNYWANELKNGRSKGNLISTMLVSARSFTGDAEWGWVPTLLDNKVAVGTYFAVQQGINYNTPEESISKTIAIVANITPASMLAARNIIAITDNSFNLRSEQVPTLNFKLISTSLTPQALFADEVANKEVVVEVKADGIDLDIVARTSFGPPGITYNKSVNLKDDGIAPDQTAADGIYSGSIKLGANPTKLQYYEHALDFIQVRIDTKDMAGKDYPVTSANQLDIGIIDRSRATAIQKIANDVYAAPYAVNVISKEFFVPEFKGAVLSKKIYQYFPDTFDVMFTSGMGTTMHQWWPSMYAVRNDVEGINIGSFDMSDTYGSNHKLRTMIHGGYNGNGTFFLHEFMHTFGFFLNKPELLLAGSGPYDCRCHPGGPSTLLGQLSAGNSLREDSDGNFTVDYRSDAGMPFGNVFADIELYLAGYKSASEIQPERFVMDHSINTDMGAKIARDKTKLVTGADIVTVYGERKPSVQNSQKEYRTLFVVASPRALTAAEMAYANHVGWFYEQKIEGQDRLSDTDNRMHTPPTFWAATKHLGTMVTKVPAVK